MPILGPDEDLSASNFDIKETGVCLCIHSSKPRNHWRRENPAEL